MPCIICAPHRQHWTIHRTLKYTEQKSVIKWQNKITENWGYQLYKTENMTVKQTNKQAQRLFFITHFSCIQLESVNIYVTELANISRVVYLEVKWLIADRNNQQRFHSFSTLLNSPSHKWVILVYDSLGMKWNRIYTRISTTSPTDNYITASFCKNWKKRHASSLGCLSRLHYSTIKLEKKVALVLKSSHDYK